MHSHVFGEIMDIEPDEKSGRRTLATQIGRVPAKFFVASLLLIECFLVSRFFSDRTITIFLALGALFFSSMQFFSGKIAPTLRRKCAFFCGVGILPPFSESSERCSRFSPFRAPASLNHDPAMRYCNPPRKRYNLPAL